MTQAPLDPTRTPPAATSGLAIAALVLGIFGLCVPVVAVVALVLGLVAMAQISQSAGRLGGQGMALAGTILGAVGVALSILALLIGMLLPALAATRETARRMQSTTQLRGIHQGMAMYGHRNNDHYPGLDMQGDPVDLTVAGRIQILLDGRYFSPDYLISPFEEGKTPWASGAVTSDHYSYAVLSIADPGGRRHEWAETLNTDAAVLSDRNTGSVQRPTSLYTRTPTAGWRGGVVWNDNHVGFEVTHVHQTQYGSHPANANDHLFEATTPHEALMIHEGQ